MTLREGGRGGLSDDAFLAGQVWHALKLPQLQNPQSHQKCDRKTEVSLDLRCSDSRLFCFVSLTVDSFHLHRPRCNSLGVSAMIKGSFPRSRRTNRLQVKSQH